MKKEELQNEEAKEEETVKAEEASEEKESTGGEKPEETESGEEPEMIVSSARWQNSITSGREPRRKSPICMKWEPEM